MGSEPLLVVIGPTAAGKTDLAVRLAEHVGGEVLSADAFTVYRGLDIGTAKPDLALRRRIPHHLIDIADPRERYSAGMFVRDAGAVLEDLGRRGRRAVVAGGTHFYVRALLYGLFPEPPKDPELRSELESTWREDAEAVRRRLAELDPEAARRIDEGDRQRILRAVEVSSTAGRPMTELWRDHARDHPIHEHLILAIDPARELHSARIARRVERMFREGLRHEVEDLLKAGVPSSAHAFKAIGYRECIRVVSGEWTTDEAVGATIVATRQLAKRQRTWLRGERGLRWLRGDDADDLTAQALRVVEESIGKGQ